MARPSNALIWNNTPRLGIPFQWLLDGYQSQWARDASSETVSALVSWADSEEFLQEAVGYTTWDGTAPTLDRVLPLECPLRSGMYCDQCVLEDFGAYEDRTDFNDPIRDNIPVQDWCVYRLTFIRPRYRVYGNNALAGLFGNRENMRFCSATQMPRPRERIVSGFGFVYLQAGGNPATDGHWKNIPEERNFISDWQRDITVTWHQVPIGAVPDRTIDDLSATVNSQPMQLVPGGKVWPPGHLLFKGLGKPIEMYQGADLSDLFDLQYLWTVQKGGWNVYPARNPLPPGTIQYQPISARHPGGANPNNADRQVIPPYPAADHRLLFVPSAAV